MGAAGRILAIDYGSVRTGLALSDPLGILASPLAVIHGDPLPFVLGIIGKDDVRCVIVGDPKTMAGGVSSQTEDARAFTERLRAATGIPVELVDERLSSVAARKNRAGMKKKHREAPVDADAAALLLEQYLAAR